MLLRNPKHRLQVMTLMSESTISLLIIRPYSELPVVAANE